MCVALAAAAPQIIAPWPYAAGYVAPYAPVARTLVAGPTVVNAAGATYTYPGVVGTTII